MQRHIWIGLLAALLAMGCGDDDDSGNPDGSTTPDGTTGDTSVDGSFTPPANIGESITTYSQIVLASYEDSITEAMALDTALDALVAGPTDATLTAAKEAWLASREPYLQTEVYRFYDGPIDNPTDGPEGLINAWPMDEAYVDYVAGMDMAGIINDPAAVPMINAASIEPLNEVGGEENVATGYHPIEFLLWGQDMDPAGPGNRPFTDYVTGGTGTAANQDRRGQYLQTASELLLRDLTQVRDAWAEGSTTNYRATFESADPLESFGNILTGMIILSGFETGGERLQTALDSGDQEDEHSCFSDNTHRDMVGDCIGIQNVYEGRYQRLDGTMVMGTSVYDIVAQVDMALADRLRTEIAASVTAAEALQPPFDQEIASGNTAGNDRVRALITALRTQEATLQEVFAAFGLTVEIPE